jgi:hypothetical protein
MAGPPNRSGGLSFFLRIQLPRIGFDGDVCVSTKIKNPTLAQNARMGHPALSRQHFLYFLPLPHGQRAFRPILFPAFATILIDVKHLLYVCFRGRVCRPCHSISI